MWLLMRLVQLESVAGSRRLATDPATHRHVQVKNTRGGWTSHGRMAAPPGREKGNFHKFSGYYNDVLGPMRKV